MKPCLVIGSAATLYEDVAAARPLAYYDVLAAKDAGIFWAGPLVAWVTLHPEKFAKAKRERKRAGYPDALKTFSNVPSRSTDSFFPDWGGSSGLFAVQAALRLGYTRIVLAGIPLTASPYLNRKDPFADAKHYRKAWVNNSDKIAPFVRSMSGWTRELLGAPTAQWLGESRQTPHLCKAQ